MNHMHTESDTDLYGTFKVIVALSTTYVSHVLSVMGDDHETRSMTYDAGD